MQRQRENRPSVSVVIPTYNRAHIILESIQSVLDQTFDNFEVIVVDDGSADDTESLVQAIDDNRVRYIKQSNLGVSVARNTGIEASTGNLVAFLDSDDIWLPQKLEKIVPLFDDPDVGWAYHDTRYFAGDEMDVSPNAFSRRPPAAGNILKWIFTQQYPMHTSCTVVRRECLEEVGMFDPDLDYNEDHDLYLRLAQKFNAAYVSDVLVHFRRRPGEARRADPIELRRRAKAVKQSAIQASPEIFESWSRPELRKGYYNNLFLISVLDLKAGNIESGTSSLRECVEFDKTWLKPRLLLVTGSLGTKAIQNVAKAYDRISSWRRRKRRKRLGI